MILLPNSKLCKATSLFFFLTIVAVRLLGANETRDLEYHEALRLPIALLSFISFSKKEFHVSYL